jgi:tetratricopeptide (TPR) repeat protein
MGHRNAAYDLGRSEHAIQYYDQALAIDPHNVDALNSKGLAIEDLGRSEEAIQYYDKVLTIDLTDVDILNNKEDAPSSLAEQSKNMSTIS